MATKRKQITKNDLIVVLQNLVIREHLLSTKASTNLQNILSKLNSIRLAKAVNILSRLRAKHRDKKFRVVFTKRSTGKKRVMIAKFNYDTYLRGGKSAYNFAEKNLMPVLDCRKKEIRNINLDGISELVVDGRKYLVVS